MFHLGHKERAFSGPVLILDNFYRWRIAVGIHIGMINREPLILKSTIEMVLGGHDLQTQVFRILRREMLRMSLGVFMIIQGCDYISANRVGEFLQVIAADEIEGIDPFAAL